MSTDWQGEVESAVKKDFEGIGEVVEKDAKTDAQEVATGADHEVQTIEHDTAIEVDKVGAEIESEASKIPEYVSGELRVAWQHIESIEKTVDLWVVKGWKNDVLAKLAGAKKALLEHSAIPKD